MVNLHQVAQKNPGADEGRSKTSKLDVGVHRTSTPRALGNHGYSPMGCRSRAVAGLANEVEVYPASRRRTASGGNHDRAPRR
ncbi:hypothetical protein C2845_PM10G11740 [Panicum miliaceum]|uniref:Uncharacterized protein n=1 Tax=Panicum miliaceum TaxID=4540 RepID=A0A3L6PCH9_PANMI|nr:hypothetical protein C2845_PM10G11740 [Panicum miliaceum]